MKSQTLAGVSPAAAELLFLLPKDLPFRFLPFWIHKEHKIQCSFLHGQVNLQFKDVEIHKNKMGRFCAAFKPLQF